MGFSLLLQHVARYLPKPCSVLMVSSIHDIIAHFIALKSIVQSVQIK